MAAACSAASRRAASCVVVGASMEPMEISPVALIGGTAGRRPRLGHLEGLRGHAATSARCTGVRPMIETFPLEQAAEAYDKMMSGDARFRMVLTTGQ